MQESIDLHSSLSRGHSSGHGLYLFASFTTQMKRKFDLINVLVHFAFLVHQ